MDGSGESKRGEAREFWEAALRLWSESGLSVRAFCQREGLRENAFYSWRRKLRAENRASEAGQEASGVGRTGGIKRRRRKQDVAGKSKDKDEKSEASSDRSREDVAAGFIELTTPMSAGVGYCMLELEKEGGAKMRVKLHGFTAADVAAIGRSFWRAES
jgi:transposase-like protein